MSKNMVRFVLQVVRVTFCLLVRFVRGLSEVVRVIVPNAPQMQASDDIDAISVGGKKGNRTEPNRTNGLYRTEPTKISDCCGTGFYLRHRTEPNECDIDAEHYVYMH